MRRGQEHRVRLRCDRHTRVDIITAERFGSVLVLQGIQRQPALL